MRKLPGHFTTQRIGFDRACLLRYGAVTVTGRVRSIVGPIVAYALCRLLEKLAIASVVLMVLLLAALVSLMR